MCVCVFHVVTGRVRPRLSRAPGVNVCVKWQRKCDGRVHSCFLPAALMECDLESSTKTQMLPSHTVVWKDIDCISLFLSYLSVSSASGSICQSCHNVSQMICFIFVVFAREASLLLLLIFRVSDMNKPVLNPAMFQTDINDSSNHVSCCCCFSK